MAKKFVLIILLVLSISFAGSVKAESVIKETNLELFQKQISVWQNSRTEFQAANEDQKVEKAKALTQSSSQLLTSFIDVLAQNITENQALAQDRKDFYIFSLSTLKAEIESLNSQINSLADLQALKDKWPEIKNQHLKVKGLTYQIRGEILSYQLQKNIDQSKSIISLIKTKVETIPDTYLEKSEINTALAEIEKDLSSVELEQKAALELFLLLNRDQESSAVFYDEGKSKLTDGINELKRVIINLKKLNTLLQQALKRNNDLN